MQLRMVIAVGLIAISSYARVDEMQTFTLQASLTDTNTSVPNGYTGQGSVVIDTTAGVIEDSNFSFSNGPVVYAFTFPYGQSSDGSETQIQFPAFLNPVTNLYADALLLFPVDSLVGYRGGPICSDAVPCPNGYGGGAYLIDTDGNLADELDMTSGTLTATPEPSSFALLATGLLSMGAVVARRLI